MRGMLAGLALVLVAAGCSGHSPDHGYVSSDGSLSVNTQPDAARPGTLPIGGTATAYREGRRIGTVTVTDPEYPTANSDGQPPKKGSFVRLTVRLAGTSTKDWFGYSSDDFGFETAGGAEVKQDDDEVEPFDHSDGELRGGKRQSMTVLLDVPSPAGQVTYQPLGADTPLARWRLPCPASAANCRG